MNIKIGVMGSASGKIDPEVAKRAYRVGVQIARRGCILVTGGCPGLPQEACRGAKEAGGITIGISPGLDLKEHIEKFRSPTDHLDVLIFTGSGFMGREVIAVRSCDIVIIVGGRSGTLGEFAIAYDEGKVIGILQNSGGISSHIPKLVELVRKQTGCEIVYDADPEALVDRLIEVYKEVGGRPKPFPDG